MRSRWNICSLVHPVKWRFSSHGSSQALWRADCWRGSGTRGAIAAAMKDANLGLGPLAAYFCDCVGACDRGIAFKIAAVLIFYLKWTPDVYEGSPTPVVAFLSVGLNGRICPSDSIKRLRVFLDHGWAAEVHAIASQRSQRLILGNVVALAPNQYETAVKAIHRRSGVHHDWFVIGVVMRAYSSMIFYSKAICSWTLK
jgi:NAD(P)H-quinone oxidoreductase subunit 2